MLAEPKRIGLLPMRPGRCDGDITWARLLAYSTEFTRFSRHEVAICLRPRNLFADCELMQIRESRFTSPSPCPTHRLVCDRR
jgi:hypothetical protein